MTEVIDPTLWKDAGGILGLVILALFAFMILLVGLVIRVIQLNSQERKQYFESHQKERKEFRDSHEKIASGMTDAVVKLTDAVNETRLEVSRK